MGQPRFRGNVFVATMLVLTLVLAYTLDQWIATARANFSQTLDMNRVVWTASVANLLLAGCVMLLAWVTRTRSVTRWFVNTLLILVGVVLTFGLGLAFRIPALSVAWFATAGPFSLLGIAGAFITSLGAYNAIVQPQRARPPR
jgi:hypothetical protein